MAGRYTYTPADVQRMVEKKRRESASKGRSNVAAEKARLTRERDFAHQTGNREMFAE